jgi:hypothetical protein
LLLLSGHQLAQPGRAAAAAAIQTPSGIAACKARTSCVSTASFLSPSNYLPPWLYPKDKASAMRCAPGWRRGALANCVQQQRSRMRAEREQPLGQRRRPPTALRRALLDQLQQQGAASISSEPSTGLVTAQLRSNWGADDQLRFVFRGDGVVLFSSSSAGNQADPPFCLTPGCISGPGNRGRLEALRDALGWSNLETDEDKEWVQILLH